MSTRDLKLLDRIFLRGPNRWSYRPAMEVLVDIGELEEFPSNTIDGFVERLTAMLPGLIEHECSYGERGGFVRRLEEGTWPGHILEHVTLELQTRAGYDAGYGRARSTSKTGVYWVVVRITHEELTWACLQAARELVLAAMDGRPFDVDGTIKRLSRLAEEVGYGPSTAAIVEAATRAKIPSVRLAQSGNLVLLGHGSHQRRIWTAETDRTSAIAEGISRDKDLTKQIISQLGVPVPSGELVKSLEQARAAAQDLEGLVVIKPKSASRGEAVTLAIPAEDEALLAEAFQAAKKFSSAVLVERYVEGEEYRLLVVGREVVAASKSVNFTVTGDGQSSIARLVEPVLKAQFLAEGRKAFAPDLEDVEQTPAVRLALRRLGLKFESVLPAGQVLELTRSAKFGVDALPDIHPQVLRQVALAVRSVGLDIAGVDIVAPNLKEPLSLSGGKVLEVNAGPSLLPHLKGQPVESAGVGDIIVRHLFPESSPSRIPLYGVAGSGDTTTVARMLGHLVHLSEQSVGVTCKSGTYLGSRRISLADSANFAAGQRLLIHRTLEAAVLETSPESILREGLPYDLCKVGVVTRVKPEPSLEKHDVLDEAQVAHILRTQIDVVLPEGAAVLNADDPLVANMAQYSKGEVIFYGRDPSSEAMRKHVAAGGRAVTIGPQGLFFTSGATGESFALDTRWSPDIYLPAAAAAWAGGLASEIIVSGIISFYSAMLAMDEPPQLGDRASSPNL